MKRKSTLILVVIVLAALFLTACGEKKFTQADVNATLTAAANGEEVKASTPTPTLSVEEQVEATVAAMMEEESESKIVGMNVPTATPTAEDENKSEVSIAGNCPTKSEMEDIFGEANFTNLGEDLSWDGCQWQISGLKEITLIEDFAYFFESEGKHYAAYGDEETKVELTSDAIVRYLPWYKDGAGRWAYNPNYFMVQMFRNGVYDSNPYQVYNYNLELGSCPTTTEEVAELIGGETDDWTVPEKWSDGWTYNGPAITITIPEDLPNWGETTDGPIWAGKDITKEFTYYCNAGK